MLLATAQHPSGGMKVVAPAPNAASQSAWLVYVPFLSRYELKVVVGPLDGVKYNVVPMIVPIFASEGSTGPSAVPLQSELV